MKLSIVSIIPKKIRQMQSGFTLIELLVVITIISVLATLVIAQLGIARSKSRDAKRIADLSQLYSGINLYFDDFGSAPGDSLYTEVSFPSYFANIVLPHDPLDNEEYGYTHDTNILPPHTGFLVWVELERGGGVLGQDHDIDVNGWPGSHSTGRLGGGVLPLPLPNDPGNSSCPDSDLSNATCTFDLGARP
jgi:prepilin-type N-terminal cleavage/methylation domain-containing protein